ncbi:phage/plasmid primase, P4 family [Paracoccus sp. p3-h83]|uniref:DNA primase family protein n=1 Tax=Paracoccus sp. p3-h83 TaxID=3342805 RepID=UPI0035B7C1D0
MTDTPDRPDTPRGLDAVRQILANPETVDLPEDLARPVADAPHPDQAGPDDAPPVDDRPADDLPPEVAEAVRDCAEFALNDFGNGRRFVRHFGTDLRFVGRIGWHVWDGRRWACDEEIAKDTAPRVRAAAQKIGPLIEHEAAWLRPLWHERETIRAEIEAAENESTRLKLIPPNDRPATYATELRNASARIDAGRATLDAYHKKRGRILTHAKNAGNSGPLSNMANEARVMLAVHHDDMDADPLALCVDNGVLRFARVRDGDRWYASAELVPHDRAHNISKLSPVIYDPDAECPTFDAFLSRIMPSHEMRRFLARWLGLSITGLTWEQRLAFFYGSGANGKSVLVDLIARILGDYAATAKIESLTGKSRRGGGDATPDLIPLVGARFVRASEPDEGEKLQEGLIKELTGGETILVRALHADFIEVRPLFKLTISGNHKPEIRATDDGIWRRVMLVPFDVQIPKPERDPDLINKLAAEASGVLNWLIGGLLEYLEIGLAEPAAVLDATAEYREDSDPIGQFLADCCAVTGDPDHSIPATELRDAFMLWQIGQAMTAWTDTTVSKRMAEKSRRYRGPRGVSFTIRKSAGVKIYDGIRLIEPFAGRFRDAPRDAQGRFLRSRAEGQS